MSANDFHNNDCNWTRTQNHWAHKQTPNHLAKWLSVCLQIKWFWVWVQLQSLKLQILHLLWERTFLDIQATIECGFTLKCIRDMTRTYSQFHNIWIFRVDNFNLKVFSLFFFKISTTIFIIFWDFLMFYQIFLSPQVERCVIITCKHGIYQFPHELQNDLKVTSATKHNSAAKEIIIYTHKARQLCFWFMFNPYLIERLHKYDGCDVDMNIRQNSENLFM